MAELTKETVITQADDSNTVDTVVKERKATTSQTIEYLVYFFFGILQLLLVFRLVLKLTGASISSAFVGFIYGVTGVFVLPFEGIFRKLFSQGAETTSVLEPSTLVAIIVYAALAWGIVMFIKILSRQQQDSE